MEAGFKKIGDHFKAIPKHLIISAVLLVSVIVAVIVIKSVREKKIQSKVTQTLSDEFYQKFGGRLQLVSQDTNPHVLYQHIMEALMYSDAIQHLIGTSDAKSRYGQSYEKALQDLTTLKAKVLQEIQKKD